MGADTVSISRFGFFLRQFFPRSSRPLVQSTKSTDSVSGLNLVSQPAICWLSAAVPSFHSVFVAFLPVRNRLGRAQRLPSAVAGLRSELRSDASDGNLTKRRTEPKVSGGFSYRKRFNCRQLSHRLGAPLISRMTSSCWQSFGRQSSVLPNHGPILTIQDRLITDQICRTETAVRYGKWCTGNVSRKAAMSLARSAQIIVDAARARIDDYKRQY